MLDSLGLLVITFIVMSVISIIGVILMFLVKNEKVKKAVFYFLAIWGMVIAYCNVQGTPDLWTGSILIAWALGGLSVIALLMQLCMKREKKFQIAQVLVAISVIVGMIDCFLI